MKKILLTSAGMNIKDEILKILPKPARQIKLAHIITASKPEKDRSYVKKDSNLMRKVGFNVTEIDIEGKNKNQLEKLLLPMDIIFVQGGNTFFLLDAVRKSGFREVAEKLMDRGVFYIGVSAGSIIAGPTIETAKWKDTQPDRNFIKLKDLTGLNWVPFNVFVHYVPDHLKFIKKEIAKTRHPLRIITDDQAILVTGKKYKLVGEDPEILLT